MAKVRIGISGWRYKGWRGGKFYPANLPQKSELEFAAAQFETIEINGSFYSLQKPESYRRWREQTPKGFVFAVKGGRFITHLRRLRDCRIPLANFFASGVLALEEKLGPCLWQLPPNLKYDPERLEDFLSLLPRDTSAAAKLARAHNEKLKGRAYQHTNEKHPIAHAIEVRHRSFECVEFVEQLRRHGVALVVADTGGKWPFMEDLTSNFVYVRLHGPKELYSSGYDDTGLDFWEHRIRLWRSGRQPGDAHLTAARAPYRKSGRDVYVYFDNDAKVDAPGDATRLIRRLRG